ncbi:hypothetical protein Poly30_47860 [Planctomycetes bacterium Poly30]|uniref:Arylsulfotransferase (ASST) n=1 Tax=Saltatorellus ferox TaxID=2528018 RepID=A0A518EYR0_9BACT|nr:hypothetical protein Poly30_47860 [Planctomycetes bacterium Poly30]
MGRSLRIQWPLTALHPAAGAYLALVLASGPWLSGCDGSRPAAEDAPAPDASAGAPSVPRGHWYRVAEEREPASSLTGEQQSRAAALESIGYAAGMEAADGLGEGVGVFSEALAEPGLNFYSSGHGPDALLMDLSGKVLHRWHRPIGTIWPEKSEESAYFRKARLFSDGVVLVVFEGQGLAALDANSELLWACDRPVHHDVHQDADGSYFALDRKARVVPSLHPDRPLADDGLVFLDPDGTVRGRASLLDGLLCYQGPMDVRGLILQRIAKGAKLEEETIAANAEALRANPELLEKIDYIGDCLHTNSVRRIDAAFAAANDGLEEGWFLVSVRELSLLAAFEVSEDFESATARWLLRGDWREQHEAVPLPDGHIMLFDNLGRTTGGLGRRSRVIDVDPATGEILRSIERVADVDLFSTVGGSCQRLPNGNTLVIESTRGSAFEVTPTGELAWSFHNPHRAGEDEELIAFLPDVIRLPEAVVRPWLPAASEGR